MKFKNYQISRPKLLNSHVSWVSIFAIMFLYRTLLENVNLPDYDSYQRIFADPENFQGWNLAFTTFALVVSNVFSYESFRLLIFILGALLYSSIYKYVRKDKLIPLLFIAFILVLEFFMIRLRAGLCIFLFYSALTLFNKSRFTLAIVNVFLAGLVHPATFFTLALIYWPIIFKVKLNFELLLILAIQWFSFLLLIDVLSVERGAHLDSEINLVRLMVLLLAPTILLAVLSPSRFTIKNIQENCEFSNIFVLNIVVLLMDLVGFFATSGEAIIRIYSLVAGPALFYSLTQNLANWSKPQIYFAFVTLVANSLFFINTVYL